MREIESIDLTPWQKEVFKIFIEHPSDSVITVKAKRQVGKSICLQQIALYHTLNRPKSSCMIVSPTINQSRRLFKELTDLLYGSGVIAKQNNTLLELTFCNGSSIFMKSAEQGDNLRGFNCTLLILDEAAFINDDIFTLLQPSTDVNHADIILFSTPMFENGFFYECYMKGLSHVKSYHSIDWGKFDTSRFLSKERLEQYRKEVPKQRFQTEYLGEFISSNDAGVFQNYLSCILDKPPVPSDKHLIKAGIDWAADGQDRTVCTIMTAGSCHVLDILILDGQDHTSTDTIKQIGDFLLHWQVDEVMVEKNSIGAVYKDMLVKEIGDIVSIRTFNTSNNSKRDIIESLAQGFLKKTLTIPNNDVLLSELATYKVEKTGKNGNITYNAQRGFHDDTIMSLAIAYKLCKENNTIRIL